MPEFGDASTYTADACLGRLNFNSFAFDYTARQKVQGTNLNWYIVEQLPVIARDGYDRRVFGQKTARELVRDHVLRLTFTSDDMAPFARDLGYTGSPFVWDAEERRHLRARLDALYFHLYGLSRDDAGYILDTFPIVRKQDDQGVRQIPHQRAHPRLHERPGRRRHRNRSEGVTGWRGVNSPTA